VIGAVSDRETTGLNPLAGQTCSVAGVALTRCLVIAMAVETHLHGRRSRPGNLSTVGRGRMAVGARSGLGAGGMKDPKSLGLRNPLENVLVASHTARGRHNGDRGIDLRELEPHPKDLRGREGGALCDVVSAMARDALNGCVWPRLGGRAETARWVAPFASGLVTGRPPRTPPHPLQ